MALGLSPPLTDRRSTARSFRLWRRRLASRVNPPSKNASSELRRGHPALKRKRISVASWGALPHLLVSPRGEDAGEADEHLAKLGLKRRIVAVVPHFLAAPLIVANSDLVTLTTKRVASYFSELLDLTIFEPPVPMGSFTIDLLASVARTGPALRWLRDQMLQICSEGAH